MSTTAVGIKRGKFATFSMLSPTTTYYTDPYYNKDVAVAVVRSDNKSIVLATVPFEDTRSMKHILTLPDSKVEIAETSHNRETIDRMLRSERILHAYIHSCAGFEVLATTFVVQASTRPRPRAYGLEGGNQCAPGTSDVDKHVFSPHTSAALPPATNVL